MEEVLRQLGLTDNELSVYMLLLKKPNQTAQQLATASNIQRTNLYRILDILVEQELIAINSESSVRRFYVTEPQNLQKLLQLKQTQLKQTSSLLSTTMPSFRSQYSLSLDKPGVFYMAGFEGFERLLLDEVKAKTEILLMASNDVPKENMARFKELLLERKRNGVKTRAIFHEANFNNKIRAEFNERGFDVRFLGNTPFKGEIGLYEDNTTFTVYDPSLMTTVITNKHITDTMRTLFEHLWAIAKP